MWVKSVWERIWHFDLSLEVDYKPLNMPRERDECIMERLVKDGVRGKRLVKINEARKVQEALFLSDIATADGRRIESAYVRHWKNSFEGTLGRHHSTFEYGLEYPSDQDRVDWEAALREITISQYFGFSRSLGTWVAASLRI